MRDFRIAHGATELLLIRHAEAVHPQLEDMPEVTAIDTPLSDHGRAQAKRLANRIATRRPNAIYASPLKRTIETAQPIAEALELPIHPDERLREVEIAGVGAVSLHDLGEIAIAHGGWSHLAGTESSTSIRTRMKDAIADIVGAHPSERVVIVSHAGAINAYVSMLLDLHKDFFFPAGNTSITVVRIRDSRRLVVTVNDTAHLEGMR
ncbi:MAG: histidine phosphatase family protein [Candidatus Eremiobacteraeota bacterium]|nr:histidine phosphatase family protein [Candidatus Eremiobacteraeota bacterium]